MALFLAFAFACAAAVSLLVAWFGYRVLGELEDRPPRVVAKAEIDGFLDGLPHDHWMRRSRYMRWQLALSMNRGNQARRDRRIYLILGLACAGAAVLSLLLSIGF